MSIHTKELSEINDDENNSSSKNTTTLSKIDHDSSNSNTSQILLAKNNTLKKNPEVDKQESLNGSSTNKETNNTCDISSNEQLDDKNTEFIGKQANNSTKSYNSMSNDYQPDNALCVEEFIKNQLQDHPKDRLFMLNIEKELIKFLNDEKRDNYKFNSMNPFYRMLVHRIGDYFGLGHMVDQLKQSVIVFKTEKTKIPTLNFQSIITSANENSNETQQLNNNKINNNASSSNSETSSNSITPNSSSLNLINVASTATVTLEVQTGSTTNKTDDSIKTQTQKKQILKREVNNQDSSKNKSNTKSSSEVKMKTFEEKSADYIRIKNRIFNNNENSNEPIASSNINESLIETNGNNLNMSESRQQFSILNRRNSSVENKVPPANNEQLLNNKSNSIQTGYSSNLPGSSSKGVVMLNSPNHLSNPNSLNPPPNHHQYKLIPKQKQQTSTNQILIQKTQQNNLAQSTAYNQTNQISNNVINNKNETTTSIQTSPSSSQPYYLIAPSYTNSNHSMHLLTNKNINSNNIITNNMNGNNGYNQNQMQAGQIVSNNQFVKNFVADAYHQQQQASNDSNSYITNNSNNQQNYFGIIQQNQNSFGQQQQQSQATNLNNRNTQISSPYQVINQSKQSVPINNINNITLQHHHHLQQHIISPQMTSVNSTQHVNLSHNKNLTINDTHILNNNNNNNQMNNSIHRSVNPNEHRQIYTQPINGNSQHSNSSFNFNTVVVTNNKNSNEFLNQNKTFQNNIVSNNNNSTMSGFELNSNYQSTSRYNNPNLKTMSNRETGKLDPNFNNNNNNNNNKLQRKIHQRSSSNTKNNQNIISSPFISNNNTIHNLNNNQSITLPIQYQNQIQTSNSFVKLQQPLPFNGSPLSNISGQINTLQIGINNQVMYSNIHNIGTNVNPVSNTSIGIHQRPIPNYHQHSAQTQINANQPHFNQSQPFNSNQMNVFKVSTQPSTLNINNATSTYQIQKQQQQNLNQYGPSSTHFNNNQNQSRQKVNGQPQTIYHSNNYQVPNFMLSNSNGNFNNTQVSNIESSKISPSMKQAHVSISKKNPNKHKPYSINSSTQEKNDTSKVEKCLKQSVIVQNNSEIESNSLDQTRLISKNINEEIPDVINAEILPVMSSTENLQISPKENTNNDIQNDNGEIPNENILKSTTITVQVYNLKQDLTKQMLKDLLKPHVASIDFKSKTKLNDADPAMTSNEDSNNFINEENEDVFIKFENLEKLRQAFKLFNLKEDQINGIQHKNESDEKNTNKSQNQETSNKNDSPFLFRQLTIY